MKKPNAYLQKKEMFNQDLLDVGEEEIAAIKRMMEGAD